MGTKIFNHLIIMFKVSLQVPQIVEQSNETTNATAVITPNCRRSVLSILRIGQRVVYSICTIRR